MHYNNANTVEHSKNSTCLTSCGYDYRCGTERLQVWYRHCTATGMGIFQYSYRLYGYRRRMGV